MLSFTGAGYFIGETEIGASFPFITSEFQQIEKKKILPKPKSFYSKRKTSNVFTGSTIEQFSFFSVLNDPSLSKIVGLNGEIIKKYDSSPAPVKKIQSSQKIHRKKSTPVSPVQIKKASSKIAVPHLSPFLPKKAKVEAGRSITLGPASRWPLDNPGSSGTPLTGGEELNNERTSQTLPSESQSPANIRSSGTLAVSKLALLEGAESSSHVNIGSSGTQAEQSLLGIVSYVVQVSAFRQWQHAQSLKAALEKKGYAAFIGKVELPGNKGTWYRVYIGRYFNQAGAKMAAARFYREENRQAMVVRQTG